MMIELASRPARGSFFSASRSATLALSIETRDAECPTFRGGDVFDAFLRPDGSASVLLADLSSKGTESVVHVNMLRRAFRDIASADRCPARIVERMNGLRFDGLPQRPGAITFASAFVAAIESAKGTLRYASAGHDFAVIVGNRSARALIATGPVLGVIPDAIFLAHTVPFGERESLVLVTDGVTECRRAEDASQQFGTTGMNDVLSSRRRTSAGALSAAVLRATDHFTQRFYRDDATIAVITHRPQFA